MALPNSNISITMVKSALGVSTNNLSELCKSPKINDCSRYKPIDYNILSLTETLRNSETGYQMADESTSWGTVKRADYVKPKGGASSPFRLGDFRGYNHSALHYKPAIQNITFTGAPAEANIFIGTDESTASFYFDVVLPEFPIWQLPVADMNDRGKIKISYGIYGLVNSFKEVVGVLDIGTACAFNTETYMANYANKTVRVNCTQTVDLPAEGFLGTCEYYVFINGLFVKGVDYNKQIGKLYKQWVQNFNDPTQWRDAVVILGSGTLPEQFTYTSIKTIKSFPGDSSGVKIEGIRALAPNFKIRVEYLYNGTYYQLVDILYNNANGYNNVGAGLNVIHSYTSSAPYTTDITIEIPNRSGVTDVKITAIDIFA